MRLSAEQQLAEECSRLNDRVNLAYRQRNNAAIAIVKMAIMLGWPAGRGIDNKVDNDMSWRHVVYIELPNGEQVSYHMAPEDVIHLDGLPCYRGKWDGKYTGATTWHSMLVAPVSKPIAEDAIKLAESRLTGMALCRWHVERRKLEADPDVSEVDAQRILLGYARAWGR